MPTEHLHLQPDCDPDGLAESVSLFTGLENSKNVRILFKGVYDALKGWILAFRFINQLPLVRMVIQQIEDSISSFGVAIKRT